MKKAILIFIMAIGVILAFSSCKDEEIAEWFTVEGDILVKYTGNEEIVEIPEGIVTIANGAFRDNKMIETVIFSDSVKTVDMNAFRGCTALSEVRLNDGIAEIRGWAFALCEKLSEIDLPDTLTVIADGAFSGTSIEYLKIPGGVTKVSGLMGIDKDCQISCDNSLKVLELCEGVLYLGDFDYCNALTKVIMPSTVETVDGFKHCTNLTDITLPEGVKSVVGFRGCEQLADMKIPSTVTGFNALRDTSFWTGDEKFTIVGDGVLVRIKTNETSVTLPEEVNYIGTTVETVITWNNESYIYSPQLEEIILLYPIVRIDSSFDGHNPKITITEAYN